MEVLRIMSSNGEQRVLCFIPDKLAESEAKEIHEE